MFTPTDNDVLNIVLWFVLVGLVIGAAMFISRRRTGYVLPSVQAPEAETDVTMTTAIPVMITLLTTAEGGRTTAVRTGYYGQFQLGNNPEDLSGALLDLRNGHPLSPGGTSSEATIRPIQGGRWAGVAYGQRLPMYEGGRLIGHANVLALSNEP